MITQMLLEVDLTEKNMGQGTLTVLLMLKEQTALVGGKQIYGSM